MVFQFGQCHIEITFGNLLCQEGIVLQWTRIAFDNPNARQYNACHSQHQQNEHQCSQRKKRGEDVVVLAHHGNVPVRVGHVREACIIGLVVEVEGEMSFRLLEFVDVQHQFLVVIVWEARSDGLGAFAVVQFKMLALSRNILVRQIARTLSVSNHHQLRDSTFFIAVVEPVEHHVHNAYGKRLLLVDGDGEHVGSQDIAHRVHVVVRLGPERLARFQGSEKPSFHGIIIMLLFIETKVFHLTVHPLRTRHVFFVFPLEVTWNKGNRTVLDGKAIVQNHLTHRSHRVGLMDMQFGKVLHI